MKESNLANLVKTNQLKEEEFNQPEFEGLISSAKKKLNDAKNISLSPESRFDLAYNAAHAFALGALRQKNYRPTNRYIVFQVLQFTTGLGVEISRVLSNCHHKRNMAEYEGHSEINETLLNDLLEAVQKLHDAIHSS